MYRLSQASFLLLSYYFPTAFLLLSYCFPTALQIQFLEVVVNMLLHGFLLPLQLTGCKMGKFMTHSKYEMMELEY